MNKTIDKYCQYLPNHLLYVTNYCGLCVFSLQPSHMNNNCKSAANTWKGYNLYHCEIQSVNLIVVEMSQKHELDGFLLSGLQNTTLNLPQI